MVDGAQGAGHMNLDVKKNHIDILAVPGHKGLMGPQGTGFLYIREGISMRPLLSGGTRHQVKERAAAGGLSRGLRGGNGECSWDNSAGSSSRNDR